MKIKSLFSASILLISATACTSDEVLLTPETAETSISFNAVTNNMTRAAHSFSASEQPEQFFVAAFLGSNFYFDPDNVSNNTSSATDCVEYKGGSWISSAQRYWPKHDALDFYAFFAKKIGWENESQPFEATKKEDNSGVTLTISNFESNTDVTAQYDLMYAVTKGAKQSDNKGTVTLNFLHALSQICFQAENEDPNSEYKITSITVSGVNGTGTFNFGDIDTTDGTGGGFWSDLSEVGNYSYAVIDSESVPDGLQLSRKGDNNDGNMDHINISNLSGVNREYSLEGESKIDYEKIRSRALNLIPQEFSSENAKIEVEFKANGNENAETVNIPLNDTTWEPGKRYIYNLKFTAGGLIEYAISIADFISDKDETDNSKDKIHDNEL